MKSNLIIDLCDYWMQLKRNLSLRNKKKNDCSALILSFFAVFRGCCSHIYALCPTWDATRMRLGIGAGTGIETRRMACWLRWLDLEGRMAGGDRLPFAQTHCNFGPGSADVADVVAKCPKMRNKHAHEFCNLPQPQVQVQRSAFSVHHQN